ncbi:hypothetical protein C8Q79DRAFT_203427 [Trametes meyenii]|nr:hypothetical protein C8Q79DRAFT_203427 [Trametes meyenii]
MSGNVVLITGAAGWLGGLLAHALLSDERTPNVRLILADIVEPKAPAGSNAITIQADLTIPGKVDTLFRTDFGIPDTVYCMHGIMSLSAEANYARSLQVNFDSVRALLDAVRYAGERTGTALKFIFTSTLAVYGGPTPPVVSPLETIVTPESAYGMAKLADELFINDYTRRGFVDGRILRLATIVVNRGALSAATASFISAIIREPLRGRPTTCPIGDSLDSPELNTELWVASPETTIANLIIAKHIPGDAFQPHTRVVCLPCFTTTIREELVALERVAGKEAVNLVRFEDDPISRRIVTSWPARMDNSYALGLGFKVDEDGMLPIVQRLKEKMLAEEA